MSLQQNFLSLMDITLNRNYLFPYKNVVFETLNTVFSKLVLSGINKINKMCYKTYLQKPRFV